MTAPRTSTFSGDHTKAQTRLDSRDQSGIHAPIDTTRLKSDMRKDTLAQARAGKIPATSGKKKP